MGSPLQFGDAEVAELHHGTVVVILQAEVAAALERALRKADRQRLLSEAEAYAKEHQADKGD